MRPGQDTKAAGARIVQESPALSADDIAEDATRRADAYGPGSEVVGPSGVVVVEGFGARVIVEKGHLELHDGVGEHRRVRRFTKIDPPRRLVIGIGTVGILSLGALRWCVNVGTPVVVLGGDGAILAAGIRGREDARLLRAQALALYTDAGIEVARYLIAEKLRGQASVLTGHLGEHDAASTLLDLVESVEVAESIEDVRQLEASGANVAFAAWERSVEVVFVRKDLERLASHWRRFIGRRSALNPGSPRLATDPVGSMLNYGYKLAEIEATLACRRMGLSESVGVLHADVAGRPSFSCDLMEAIRPLVDGHVLNLAAGPLRKREFTEDERGVVRCLPPLTTRLAEAMPAYEWALGPVIEHVAMLLAKSSPYDVAVPTVISGAKHKAAARRRVDKEREEGGSDRPKGRGPGMPGLAPRGRRRRPAPETKSPPLPLTICRGCGAQLPVDDDRSRPRVEWCQGCLPNRRQELAASLPVAARRAARRFTDSTGTMATHTQDAKVARSSANARQRAAQRTWDRGNHEAGDGAISRAWYSEQVAPKLRDVTLPAMARVTGVSTSGASKWRAGRTIPHPRHWAALATLVGVGPPPVTKRSK
jgi:CRISPR-associated endonuclease Cas1